ncbi:glycosyltransferase family 4 protein [Alcanivorax sp. DP30]|uniref:glycosyltransferase family 4 protein n=1 Tax=Alcanivorax sp. DP30 TaxID=2606217 RepID=UPI0013700885|nr:glycosyltransferase [Alcanivorax sp. DP30]
MKILVITKRKYTGKDLLDDQYGRLFEIPAELANLGHDVKGIALSYTKEKEGLYQWNNRPNLCWHSLNALPFGLINYSRHVDQIAKSWKPDIIWASSDMINVALANKWAKKNQVPLVVDLYDNYESFGLSKLPLLGNHFKKICREARGVTAVSNALLRKVERDYGRYSGCQLIPNSARTDLFYKRKKSESRAKLGLPQEATIIGTAGAITRHRGIEDLFKAFEYLASHHPNIWMAIAGPKDNFSKRYRHPRLIDLGILDLEQVPDLLSSLDAGVICNKASDFGDFCSPLKLMEFLSAEIPFVAANTGDIAEHLNQDERYLYRPGDWKELAGKIETQLTGNFERSTLPKARNWKDSARRFHQFLKAVNID